MTNCKKFRLAIAVYALITLSSLSTSSAALTGPVQGGTNGTVTYTTDSIDATYSGALGGSVGNLLWNTTTPMMASVSFDYLILGNSPFNNIQIGNDFNFDYFNSLSFTDGQTHHFADLVPLVATENVFLTANAGDGPGSRVYLSNINVSAVALVPEPESYALMLAGLCFVGCVAQRRKR